jgi:transcriptional regulator with XRE-family HTH domain
MARLQRTLGVVTELEALGLRLQALRGARSQREVAEQSGLDISTISRLERGKIDPSYRTLDKLRRSLSATWDALVTEDADRIHSDVLVQLRDGTVLALQMRAFTSGSDRAAAAQETSELAALIVAIASARGTGVNFVLQPPASGKAETLSPADRSEVQQLREVVADMNRRFAEAMTVLSDRLGADIAGPLQHAIQPHVFLKTNTD